MSPRDLLEDFWHLSLLVFAVPSVLRFLASRWWACAVVAAVVFLALAYHVAVVHACYAHQPLCYWG